MWLCLQLGRTCLPSTPWSQERPGQEAHVLAPCTIQPSWAGRPQSRETEATRALGPTPPLPPHPQLPVLTRTLLILLTGYGEPGAALLLPILSRRQGVEVASVDPTGRLAPADQLGEGSPTGRLVRGVWCPGRRPQPAPPGWSQGVVSGLDVGHAALSPGLASGLRAREAGRAAQRGSLLTLVLKSLCLSLW